MGDALSVPFIVSWVGLSVVRSFGDFIDSCRNSTDQNSYLGCGHVLDTKNGHRDSNCKIQEDWATLESQRAARSMAVASHPPPSLAKPE